jgi:hypothetical protein
MRAGRVDDERVSFPPADRVPPCSSVVDHPQQLDAAKAVRAFQRSRERFFARAGNKMDVLL